MQRELVEREIVRIVRESLLLGSGRPIPLDASLGRLGVGLDSLAIVDLITAVEAAFGIELPDEVLAAHGSLSLGDLVDLVASSTPVGAASAVPAPRDPAIPRPHHRMERMHFLLARRGWIGRILWAAARRAWPVKTFLFARSRHVLLQRSLDTAEPTPISPPPGVVLRSFTSADRGRLAGLWPDFQEGEDRRSVERWLREGAIALVAVEGSRVVALDLISASGDRGRIELERASGACWGLYLQEAPDVRGRRIGLALLAYSLEAARERGFRTQLTAVREDNAPMLAACTQLLGFRSVGTANRTHILGRTRWSWEVDGRRESGGRLSL